MRLIHLHLLESEGPVLRGLVTEGDVQEGYVLITDWVPLERLYAGELLECEEQILHLRPRVSETDALQRVRQVSLLPLHIQVLQFLTLAVEHFVVADHSVLMTKQDKDAIGEGLIVREAKT